MTTKTEVPLCEDDGIPMEEFEDAEGQGWSCPSCGWIVMASELEKRPEPPKPERRTFALEVTLEVPAGMNIPDAAIQATLARETVGEWFRVLWYDEEGDKHEEPVKAVAAHAPERV